MKKLIEKALDKLLTTKSFQDYVNGRINQNYLGQRFCVDDIPQLYNLYAIQNYNMNDLKPDDVVLDLGANIGAFSLPASTKCKHVYAIEPLYYDVLRKNCELNSIKNISVLPCAIGYPGESTIEHGNRNKTSKVVPLNMIYRLCRYKPTFLKIDIEGYEWFITPEDFNGIREIEGEIHFTNGKANNGNHEVSDIAIDLVNAILKTKE